MLLSDLLGSVVRDSSGHRLGVVVDARFRLEGRAAPARARLVGFVVSPRSRSSYLGYERRDEMRPAIIGRLLRWRHRGSFLVDWSDVARLDLGRVALRSGYVRHDPRLGPHED
jgi:hypothetical protein